MSMLSHKDAIEQLEAMAADGSQLTEAPLSQGRLALRRFRGRRSGMIGLSIVLFLVGKSPVSAAVIEAPAAALSVT